MGYIGVITLLLTIYPNFQRVIQAPHDGHHWLHHQNANIPTTVLPSTGSSPGDSGIHTATSHVTFVNLKHLVSFCHTGYTNPTIDTLR